ncbi:indigoidine synthase A like protein [Ilyonectria robusta]
MQSASFDVSFQSRPQVLSQADILVAGSVAIDLTCDCKGDSTDSSPSPHLHTSNPAIVTQSIGGVGRNVALAAHQVSSGSGVRFCSIIGDDIAGASVMSSLKSYGMDVSCIQKLDKTSSSSARTAEYIAINGSDKNLFLAMADMNIFSYNTFSTDWDHIVAQSNPKWLVVDANWSASSIASWIKAGKKGAAKIAFEPVSQAKSANLFCPHIEGSLGIFPQQSVHLSTPNQYELESMHHTALTNGYFNDPLWQGVHNCFNRNGITERLSELAAQHSLDFTALQKAVEILPYIPTLITKLGSNGAVLTQIISRDDPRLSDPAAMPFILKSSPQSDDHIGGIYIRFYPVVEKVKDVISVNGVGDTFLGILVSGLASGGRIEHLIDVAQQGAVMTLRSPESVSPILKTLKANVLAAASYKR